MKEKALKRYAHFISILLNIVCIVFGVLSVSLFAGIVVIVCARLFLPEMFHQAWETAVKAGQTLSFGQCAFFFICCLGMLICICKGNSPFTAETASQIRKIALYVLVFAVFSAFSVFKMAFSQFFMSGLFALVLFCISLIFDYGCELQQEVDETL